ncbi:unnamed protein product, partial [Symbiodinium necroappetens]
MTNADMSSAGRVYQNPSAPRELWFNFGWYIKTMQKFPRYDAHWMGDFTNEGHYDEIASNLTKKLAHSNIGETHDELGEKAGKCCVMTCCLCCPCITCCLCLQKHGILAEQAKLSAFLAHFLVIHGIKLNMRIEFVEQKSGEVGPTWYDSKKEPLRLVAFDRQFGGPPPGCNLVIITDTAVQWPPPPPPPPPVDPSKAAEQPTGAVTGAVKGAVSWVKGAVKGAVGGAK